MQDDDIEARKDSERQERQTTTTNHHAHTRATTPETTSAVGGGSALADPENDDPVERFALTLNGTANLAVDERWGERVFGWRIDMARPLAADLVRAGVPIDLACDVIHREVAKKRDGIPGSIEYFRKAILRAHHAGEQKILDSAHGRRSTSRSDEPIPLATLLQAPEAKAAAAHETRLRELYDTARDTAARAWAEDPVNRGRVVAMTRTAQEKCEAIPERMRVDAIRVDVLERCIAACGFPAFPDWRRQPVDREPIASEPDRPDAEKRSASR